MPSTRAPTKDAWYCQICDASARLDPSRCVLYRETRPSAREHHPGTILAFPARHAGGSIVEGVVLRTVVNMHKRIATTWIQPLGADDAEGPASRLLASMTPREVWQTLLNLCCGNSNFAFEALVSVYNMRKLRPADEGQ